MKSSTPKGFTLIELLVVIAIIGILSSVVLASLNTARQKARDGRRISDIKQIQLALELYYDASQSFPVITDALAGIYISTVPKDPSPPNSAYSYAPLNNDNTLCSGGTCTRYVLAATLETSNMVLTDDVDGTVGGVNCADTPLPAVFCVQQ